MIEVRGLRKRYGERVALDGVDAAVKGNEIVAVVGASGCGKSTLLRCFNALESFEEGHVAVDGCVLSPHGGTERGKLRALRRSVGMVFQEFHLFPHLSVLENVTLAPRIVASSPPAEAEARARELLERVGLGDRADARPGELSGGQKQRVAIARALAMPLRLLLLDEPTSALDPEMREEVREVLRSLARDRELTMVLVTHEMRLAAELADTVWSMEAGRIVARGAAPEVLRDAR
ncbi:MAG TPA: amino acid ABC transporter ATP-binding protein [Polyangiaceae bacterium]